MNNPITLSLCLISLTYSLAAQDATPAAPAPNPPAQKEQEKEKESAKEKEKEKDQKQEEQKQEPKKVTPENDGGKKPSLKPHLKYDRQTHAILQAWVPVMEKGRPATVVIQRHGKQIAMGCAIHADGFIVTKASQLIDKKGNDLGELEVQFSTGMRLAAKIVDRHRRFDLGLLKVEAKGLPTIEWDDSEPPSPGSFLAATQHGAEPMALGVMSVRPRSMDDSQKGFLGVELEPAKEGGIRILNVRAGTPGSRAGMVSDDVIKAVDGKVVTTVTECIESIAACKPYQTVVFKIMRASEEKDMKVTLGVRPSGLGGLADDPRNTMAGPVSNNRTGYPDAFSHDAVLEPHQIGGPMVDLRGRVVGMNIARSGRIECYAIPSRDMKQLISTVGEGHLYHPDVDALREQRKAAETAIEEMKKDIEKLKKQIDEAEGPAPDKANK